MGKDEDMIESVESHEKREGKVRSTSWRFEERRPVKRGRTSLED